MLVDRRAGFLPSGKAPGCILVQRGEQAIQLRSGFSSRGPDLSLGDGTCLRGVGVLRRGRISKARCADKNTGCVSVCDWTGCGRDGRGSGTRSWRGLGSNLEPPGEYCRGRGNLHAWPSRNRRARSSDSSRLRCCDPAPRNGRGHLLLHSFRTRGHDERQHLRATSARSHRRTAGPTSVH